MNLNYPQLLKLRQDLGSHVPSDPTFMAAAGTILRAWIDDIIEDARKAHEADQKAAEEQAQAQAPEPAGEPVPEPAMAEAEEDSHPRRRR